MVNACSRMATHAGCMGAWRGPAVHSPSDPCTCILLAPHRIGAREHLSSALKLVQLQHQKLDLLQGGGDAGEGVSGARRAAAESLDELRAAIGNHLNVSGRRGPRRRMRTHACMHDPRMHACMHTRLPVECQQPAPSLTPRPPQAARAQETGAAGGRGAEAARGAALASLQREEAKLADQANRLSTEVGWRRVWGIIAAGEWLQATCLVINPPTPPPSTNMINHLARSAPWRPSSAPSAPSSPRWRTSASACASASPRRARRWRRSSRAARRRRRRWGRATTRLS
jgi:hypothetical protein